MNNLTYTIFSIFFLSISISAYTLEPQKQNKNQTVEIITVNKNAEGTPLVLNFTNGKAHNHPTIVVWVETLEGEFVQTIYVTESLATGTYGNGAMENGMWSRESGPARRPATLPYYLHKRGVKADDGTYLPTPDDPILDAYSGATPKNDFVLDAKVDRVLNGKFKIMVEVNQPWDWNEYWNNVKYPDDVDYATSCQPSLIYQVIIDADQLQESFILNPVGHGHYSGKDGLLYTDISTLTTAKEIFGKIEVSIK